MSGAQAYELVVYRLQPELQASDTGELELEASDEVLYARVPGGATACSSATTVTLDRGGAGVVGLYTSIAIGPDGLGVISYYDDTNYVLKVARCTGTDCLSAATTIVDNGGASVVGWHTSIAIGDDGLGLISYWDGGNGDLKTAHLGVGVP